MTDKEQVIQALRATLISVKGALTIKQCNSKFSVLILLERRFFGWLLSVKYYHNTKAIDCESFKWVLSLWDLSNCCTKPMSEGEKLGAYKFEQSRI